jgi:hypothetical protein
MKRVKSEALGRREVTQGNESVALAAKALRQGWWLVVLVVALVGAIEGIQYLRAPRAYFAAQKFYIQVLPVGASSSYDNYQASVWAETIGHALAEGRLTQGTGGFTAAINSELKGKIGPHDLTSAELGRALVWSNFGNMVTLNAYWSTPEGAAALVSATTAALLSGDLTHVTIWRGALPENLVAYAEVVGPPSAPELYQGQQEAELRGLLLARLALSVPAGLLLLFGLAWRQRRIPRAP